MTLICAWDSSFLKGTIVGFVLDVMLNIIYVKVPASPGFHIQWLPKSVAHSISNPNLSYPEGFFT